MLDFYLHETLNEMSESELKTNRAMIIGDMVYKLIPTLTGDSKVNLEVRYSVYDSNKPEDGIGESSEKNYEIYDTLFDNVKLNLEEYINKNLPCILYALQSKIERDSNYDDIPSEHALNMLSRCCEMSGDANKLKGLIPIITYLNNAGIYDFNCAENSEAYETILDVYNRYHAFAFEKEDEDAIHASEGETIPWHIP